MATGSIDLVDVPFIALFSITAAAALGMFTLPIPFIDLTDVLFTLGSGPGKLAISLATIGSLLSLAFAFYTNRLDYSSMEGVEYWIVVATVGLVLATPFKVVIATLLPNQTAAFFAWIVQSGGILSLAQSG